MDQTKAQPVYEDGLIVSYQTSNKIPVAPEQLQQQIPVMPSPPPAEHGQYVIPENPYSDKTYYQAPPSDYPPTQFTQNPRGRPDMLKRRLTWIISVLVIVVVVLAGITGGMASGSIKTSANSGAAVAGAATGTSGTTNTPPTYQPSNTPTPTQQDPKGTTTSSIATRGSSSTSTSTSTTLPQNPKVETTTVQTKSGTVTLECPSADGLDYNLVNKKGQPMAFARYCDVNFPDGDLGLVQNKVILSMPECITECANTAGCVGVIFNPIPNCWLKKAIGMMSKESVFGTEAAILQQ